MAFLNSTPTYGVKHRFAGSKDMTIDEIAELAKREAAKYLKADYRRKVETFAFPAGECPTEYDYVAANMAGMVPAMDRMLRRGEHTVDDGPGGSVGIERV